MSCRQLEVGSLPPRMIGYSRKSVTTRLRNNRERELRFRCCTAIWIAVSLAALGQQQIAPILDRGLGGLCKSLQQPGQRHFHPDMVIRHIDTTRRYLPQRADAKDHAIVLPSLLIDLQHRHAGSGTGQSLLEAAGCLFAAKAMRKR